MLSPLGPWGRQNTEPCHLCPQARDRHLGWAASATSPWSPNRCPLPVPVLHTLCWEGTPGCRRGQPHTEAQPQGPRTLSGQRVSLRGFGGGQHQQERRCPRSGPNWEGGHCETTRPDLWVPPAWVPLLGQRTKVGSQGPARRGDLPQLQAPVCRQLWATWGPTYRNPRVARRAGGGQAHRSRRILRPRAHPFLLSAQRPLGPPSPPVDGNACG